ncbi:MAG: ABC transporter substrate-binding protein [Thermodesulfobacteriota bacterium]|nr:ABC transporter substrate-binding protein [Thermodesulfobacteriota bacterium]
MKRLPSVLLLIFFFVFIMMAPQVGAEQKTDGKPDGGTLNYGEYGRPTTLDPITSNDMISMRITELIFNGLVGINEKQEIVPELAERWEMSEDGKFYTFYLRQDVTWHPKEGEEPVPFTADDVIFTYNIMMHPKTITSMKVRYEFIESVVKTDDFTVQFTLKRPILNALAKFSFKVIPQNGPANQEFLSREDPFAQRPIGTGPYMLKNITADREVILVANENYFKGRPHINKFAARPFADQNIMSQALLFNAIDMIVLVNHRDIPQIQGDKRYVLQPYNALSYSFFGYNIRNPLLADKRVRKAFTYAVNRQEMLDSFFQGQGTIISGPFAPGSWAYNLDVQPLDFDPEKAIELLNEAGFVKGDDGIMVKDGQKLSLTLKVPIAKESEAVKRVVLAFKNYLNKIGVDIEGEFKEWLSWKEDVFLNHDFDIIFASWVFDDSADISSLFHSAEIGQWKNNFGAYSNPEIDSLIVESKLTLDHEKRRTINRKLHAIIADESPYTFLWTLTNYAAFNKKLRRVAIHPYKFFSFADDWFIPTSEQR